MDRKSRGPEVTWTGSHVDRKSRGPEVTWTGSHVDRKSRGPEVTWTGSHVDRKSRGPEVTWTGSHVDRKSRGPEVTWTGSHVDRKSRGPEVTWTGSHVDRKSRGQEVTWTGSHVDRKSRGPEVTWTGSHVDRKSRGPEVTWTGSHVDRKSRGQEVTWTGSHVDRKSRGPEVTWTGSHLDRKIDGQFLTNLRFADDIFLCTETPQELQQMLQELSDESRRLDLKMNIAKTKVMVVDNTPIKVNNVPIENVEGYVYLGQRYSLKEKNQDKEIQRIIMVGWAAYAKHRDIFKSNLDICLKRQVYNSCVLPAMTLLWCRDLGPVVGIRLIFVGTKSLRPDWQV